MVVVLDYLQVSAISACVDDRLIVAAPEFRLHAGQILHVTGENGAGKTSLLLALSLFYGDAVGINWCGLDVVSNRAEYLRQLCYCGHLSGFYPQLSLMENIKYWLILQAVKLPVDDICKVLSYFNLQEFQHKRVHELSAGQCQKLSLSKLMLVSKKIWLLDEPFSYLDAAGEEGLMQLFRRHLSAQGMIVLTSHRALTGFDHGQVLPLVLERRDDA